MNLIAFLKLVEIQTKVASLFPFLIGILYSKYRYDAFDLKNIGLMFLSLLAIDLATTAINNYMDYKKAVKTHGFNFEEHNAIVNYNLKESAVLGVIAMLILTATVFGLILYLNTDIVVLLIGIVSFGVGILYSFGPIPISRTPLGEVFSGFFMGFLIFFLTVYINIYDLNFVQIGIEGFNLQMNLNVKELVILFLVALPMVAGIANIMLANNICDIEDDIENNRYTLPIYIGKKMAMRLFKGLYYIAFLDVLVLIILQIIPMTAVLVLITMVPVRKLLKMFDEKQTKKDTFVVSVKSFVLISASYLVGIGLGILF